MAISSYPTPADAGVLCIILANTAISISIVKEIVRSILHVIGIRIDSWEELSGDPSESAECRKGLPGSYMEEFRSQIPALRFDSLSMHDCLAQECSICLTEFEPNAEVNHLTCGHVFHNLCLEKWLNYWNTTCPLCRNCMMPHEVDEDTCPMWAHQNPPRGNCWFVQRSMYIQDMDKNSRLCSLMPIFSCQGLRPLEVTGQHG